jgi:3-dehydroquinate dehydratase
MAVTSSDVRMIVERITSDVLAALGEFLAPAGYGHLSLALVDAVYSIRLPLYGCGARRRGPLRGFGNGLPGAG